LNVNKFRNASLRIVLLPIILSSFLLSSCSQLYFYPEKHLVRTPRHIGLSYENLAIPMSDQRNLHGWFMPAIGKPKGTILHFHGNAENISTHIVAVYWLPSQGYNVIMVDYRGYGKSEDVPDLDAIMSDMDETLVYLLDVHREKIARPFIVFGQSLGGAIAANVVANNPTAVDALVIESSFTSFRRIARDKLGEVFFTWPLQWPLSFLFSDSYSPALALSRIHSTPVLIMHGNGDKVISVKHGRDLYQAANSPKEYWELPEGRHIEAMLRPETMGRFLNYLDQVKTK